jgi:HAD superfamily hydrolase (TIGR01459 family)
LARTTQPAGAAGGAGTTLVDGVGSFVDRFDAFLIDQWGVLHNGAAPYAGAIELLAELHRRGKRLVLLTNSGRRRSYNAERLLELGFDTSVLTGIVTSGEATWLALQNRTLDAFQALGRRCLLFTREGDMGPVEGLDLEVVEDPGQAEFVYLTWLDTLTHDMAEFDRIIAVAAARGLPMVCSNPDRVAPTEGGLTMAPGALAERYHNIGGRVIYVGKPHAPIYAACRDMLPGVAAEAICGIGDSFEHDIKGAKDAGLAAAFIMRGIHAEAFPEGADPAADRAALENLARRHGAMPDYALPGFCL